MYLCFDVGNTTIEIALCDETKILNKIKIDTNTKASIDYFENILKEFINTNLIEGIIISSVVPSLDELLEQTVMSLFNIKPIFVRNNLNHEINILIENPEELGADLLISSIAACKKYKGTKLIVDLGTANKLLVVKENDFLGGAIAPGFKSSLNSLFNDAEKLSLVPIDTPKNVIGNSTISCIQSGIIYGTVSMIEGMIERIKKEIGELTVLLTGGNAVYIKDVIQFDFEYCPDLLIEGLMELYVKNR